MLPLLVRLEFSELSLALWLVAFRTFFWKIIDLKTAKPGARLLRSQLQTAAEVSVIAASDKKWKVFYDVSLEAWDEYDGPLAAALSADWGATADKGVRLTRAVDCGMRKLDEHGTLTTMEPILGASGVASFESLHATQRAAYNALSKPADGTDADETFGEGTETPGR